ncbi:alanine--tRNA ligase [Dictyobacter aurantiacus]|uniref:Alanine--tRNA ligase n=1 Tax=Dictyobacter aurantiacus TaxID=1936993 RepID=A0A401ZHQ2_9CHLR|nr:alanine--tRNA ligase [Dictyobacter aurantiacus]GCE06382.1 hypothetical protein KDAU_37110 [Dictyobacter aurantiacus]
MMHSSEIRRTFLDYFQQKQHTYLSSSPLVLSSDKSLLFVNAGMVPFKNVFLGLEQPPSARACSSQKCLRVSGKHNDLEEVGRSPRHHTFFEMLGNFSFGDYFKQDAIHYAWELLTQVFHLSVERLWITVYQDDEEAARIWEDVGVRRERILPFGAKDNFWSMGETGPCGPSSEIHYYLGSDPSMQHPEGVNSDDDDYMELWNLVFMQYNRDEQGSLTPLSAFSVDTGMGLERLTTVLQGVKSSYGTDLFVPILQRLLALNHRDDAHYQQYRYAYNAIADHSRALAFLIAEHITPGNGGRDYVSRRLIRRAAYLGRTLGLEQPFLAPAAQVCVDILGEQYPELLQIRTDIDSILTMEEKRFQRTLTRGLRYLDESCQRLTQSGLRTLPGPEAFKLYDTFGFPFDLTQKILAERGLDVSVQDYEEERIKQQQRSRQHALFKA